MTFAFGEEEYGIGSCTFQRCIDALAGGTG
jgi:hypothetical protein